jgi:hypothetical protein
VSKYEQVFLAGLRVVARRKGDGGVRPVVEAGVMPVMVGVLPTDLASAVASAARLGLVGLRQTHYRRSDVEVRVGGLEQTHYQLL